MARVSPKKIRESMRLYAVTDSSWLAGRSLASCVEEALAGGATCVQLREKDKATSDLVSLARQLIPVCRRWQAPFIVNDDAAAALQAGADGVHIGQEDMGCEEARVLVGPDLIVGVSVQTVEQALEAERQGADYLGVGAVFGTPTKPEAVDVSLSTLAKICAAVRVPVVAIGGLHEDTIARLAGCGVDGAAVVSALFAAGDIGAAARRLRKSVDGIIEDREEAGR